MKSTFTFVGIVLLSISGYCQTITWAEHAAPIIYNSCVKCHNSNGIAPFELLTYETAAKYKAGIKKAVASKYMPPWPASTHYQRYGNERILSAGEIDTLVKWVDGGGIQGDLSKAPAAPVIASKAEITNPDLVLQIPTFNVNAVEDIYRCFIVPTEYVTDKYITDIEIVPGNRPAVHHVLVFNDLTHIPDSLDAAHPGPGYTCFGGTGSSKSELMGGWAPGQMPVHLPTGMGIKLPKSSKVIIQIHYPANTINKLDSTKVLLKHTSTPQRNLFISPVINHARALTNGPLFIPANTTKTFNAQWTIPFDGSFLQVAPHMHLIGKTIKSWGVTPSNDTIPFISIPQWDFHWQGFYNFRSLIKIPQGTHIQAEALYDNTVNNPHNHHAIKDVKAGEATTDEMMIVYFSFLQYQQGDENINLNPLPLKSIITSTPEYSVVSTPQFYDLSPNPSSDYVEASVYLTIPSEVKVEVYDNQGRKHKISVSSEKYASGHNRIRINTSELSPGQYVLQLNMNGVQKTKSFIKL